MALLGSGEFEPWSEPVERELLRRSRASGGPVLVLPTAAAHEGDESFDAWAAKGLEHYRGMGVPAEVLPLKTREDAHRGDLVSALDGASMVFFSGGNPARLSEVLRDTPFWRALCAAVRDGLGYAGCSAGVACLTEVTFDSDVTDFERVWAPGLGYARGILFGPHWDMVDTWIPGATEAIVRSVEPGRVFVGLDEETAMVGDGVRWTVMGRAGVHVLRDGTWEHHDRGDGFELPLALADGTGRSPTGMADTPDPGRPPR
ncbi:MAG TPA: Type 1 glutamine amidotransferase-like domain-containing protein [Actinomycetota bacterium]|jgi:cyanophycinase|nr:Type 1 glutamine amidotransferase-like domain-containing protein [Actinomycetota bacterium]